MPAIRTQWRQNTPARSRYAFMNFLSNALSIRYDESTKSLLIEHPNKKSFPDPLVTVREDTYSSMTLDQACEFIGSRIILLMPAMREQYKEEIDRLAASEHGKKK